MCMSVCVCVYVCVCVCVRACARACVHACLSAYTPVMQLDMFQKENEQTRHTLQYRDTELAPLMAGCGLPLDGCCCPARAEDTF